MPPIASFHGKSGNSKGCGVFCQGHKKMSRVVGDGDRVGSCIAHSWEVKSGFLVGRLMRKAMVKEKR